MYNNLLFTWDSWCYLAFFYDTEQILSPVFNSNVQVSYVEQ